MSKAPASHRQRQKPITLQMIAHTVGVSTATVSLALRPDTPVAAATRQAVLQAARDLGYVYNRSAASLRTTSSGIIGVAFHDFANPFFIEALTAIERAASEASRSVLVSAVGDDLQRQRTAFGRFTEYRLDGAVVCPAIGSTVADLDPLIDAGIPIVLVIRDIAAPDIDFVGCDNVAGMELALDHLIELGHRRIALIGGPKPATTSLARQTAYRRILAERGLPVDSALEGAGPMVQELGHREVDRLLALPDPPTAAVCTNDPIAIGVINRLLFRGLRPGADFSVVGFDDVQDAALTYPGLTTIHSGQALLGERTMRMLTERMADPDLPARRFLIDPTLVIRGSTAPPVRR